MFPDIGLWLGTAHWRRDDRLRGHSLVPCTGDHVELDALQHDRWLTLTHLWPFHPNITVIVINRCPTSVFSGYLVGGLYNGWTPYRKDSVSWYRPYPFQWYTCSSCTGGSDIHLHNKSCRLNAQWHHQGSFLFCFSTTDRAAPESNHHFNEGRKSVMQHNYSNLLNLLQK